MENGQNAVPSDAAELANLTAATELLWLSAKNAEDAQYPGFAVTHDGTRATFTMRYSPTRYDQIALYEQDGVWQIEQQTQTPAMEAVGVGGIVRNTTTQPLALGSRALKMTEVTSLANLAPRQLKSEAVPHSLESTEEALAANGCRRLLETLRTIRGEEQPQPQPRKVRRSWMSRMRHSRPQNP